MLINQYAEQYYAQADGLHVDVLLACWGKIGQNADQLRVKATAMGTQTGRCSLCVHQEMRHMRHKNVGCQQSWTESGLASKMLLVTEIPAILAWQWQV